MKILGYYMTLFVVIVANSAAGQQVFDLYSGKIPGNIPCNVQESAPVKGELAKVTTPSLAAFFPKQQVARKTAVLILPGGGYDHLAITHEGYDIAKAFNAHGITAFVLKYRLPDAACYTDQKMVPLQDAKQAMAMIRKHAKDWNINPEDVGVIGFSAGGHLAATLLTKYNLKVLPDEGGVNYRPDWGILAYPVISMSDAVGHLGSSHNLLGVNAADTLKNYFSAERFVTAVTPPCFIFHAQDDQVVPVQNSLLFYEALLKNKVPAELHIFKAGRHGFGLHNATTKESWFDEVMRWLTAN